MVTTIHGFSSERIVPVYAKYNGRTSYVAISDADRHPDLDYVATVHHGIDTDSFHCQLVSGSYLAFFGRIHPDKGVVEAIDTAERAGIPLRIAGIVQDEEYYQNHVLPRVDGEMVRYIGPVGAGERSSFLGGALALLHLINFDEPFGFSVAEAMACGTPVIAFDRGSMSELIDDGTTGLLVADVPAAAAAARQVSTLDRGAIRNVAVSRFGRDRMVDEYLAVYAHVLAAGSAVQSEWIRPSDQVATSRFAMTME
jgi:glycosyltransferase involved in cell wall biosynthesis